MILGIDVAHYQGAPNWQTVKDQSAVEFAICKATESTSIVDARFNHNWTGIKNAGLVRGAYHFARLKNNPTDEANHFVNTVGNLSFDTQDLLALDIEDDSLKTTMFGKDFTDWVITWLERVEASTGKIPIIYTGGPYWTSRVGTMDPATSAKLEKYHLWLSAYVKNPTPYIPKPWKASKGWTIWQKSGGVAASGELPLRVPGITGLVDQNVFNGTVEEFKALVLDLHTPTNNNFTDAIDLIVKNTTDEDPTS